MRNPFRRIWTRLIRSSDVASVPHLSSGEVRRSDRLDAWLPEMVGGRFVVGANLPWIDYGTDFGTSAWHTSGGISGREESRTRLEVTLQTLGADGIPLVRVFVLCDGRSGVKFDGDGLPIDLDDEVFLDFHLCKPPQIVGGVQLGGRGHLIATVDGRAATIEHVVEPIVRRYGTHEAIAAWDVFNEPEWCLRLLPALSRTFDPFEALQEFLRSAVSAVRSASSQPVTVGSAGTWQLDLVRPLRLDVYQIHWYERFGWKALEQPVAELGLDAPAILGEFSGRSDRVAAVLHSARRAGYSGALVWSVLADDDQSGYSPEIAGWARAHGPGTAIS